MRKNSRTSFLSKEELKKIGFKSIGENVKISRNASIYSPGKISIGNNVRIDDFCILSGKIIVRNNIHISAYCALYGGETIILDDFSGLSPRCTLFSATDDFLGDYLIGPQNTKFSRNVIKGEIKLNKYCQLGANTVVLPNVNIGEGSVTGAMSLVNKNLDKWGIYVGSPVKKIKDRSKKLLKLRNE